MRPTFGWDDLSPSTRVAVWGLGVEGRANVRRLEAAGIEPFLVDDTPTDPRAVATSAGGLDLLASCDVVIKTPGISRYRDDVISLETGGVPVVGGLGLWLHDADRSAVVCVTGTKGKSTTVSIAGHLARALGARCFVGGNIGMPPYDPAAGSDFDLWVIEVSSYQATDVGHSPPVVGVTSLHADHLDWHHTVDQYYRDKLSLASQRGARISVCGDDHELRKNEPLLGPTVRWVAPEEAASWWSALGLVGRHNASNAAVAAAVLQEVGLDGAADPDALRAASIGFAGLDSRLQLVAALDGVDFYDDSLSTNVLPTIAAIDAFPGRRVAVILGGFDRGIDYSSLAEHLSQRPDETLALTVPDNGDRIAAALEKAASPQLQIERCDDVASAVKRGYEWARPNGVVLLSPAAPSFGRFRDYRERGAIFKAAALECGAGSTVE